MTTRASDLDLDRAHAWIHCAVGWVSVMDPERFARELEADRASLAALLAEIRAETIEECARLIENDSPGGYQRRAIVAELRAQVVVALPAVVALSVEGERCSAQDSAGVQCERPAGHDGAEQPNGGHACPEALASFRRYGNGWRGRVRLFSDEDPSDPGEDSGK